MIYSSLLFIYGFFPLSLLIYFLLPKGMQRTGLLLMSMVFCGAFGTKYLLTFFGCTVINYTLGRIMGQMRKNGSRFTWIPLVAGLSADMLMLFVFRARLPGILKSSFAESSFPLGVSFLSLSVMGYLMDVYRGKCNAERNIVSFCLYTMYFPRLIMGPLLRYDIFRKAVRSRDPSLEEIGVGMSLFVKGLAKKVLAADNLFMMYNAVRSVEISKLSALSAWLGALAYVLCLYFTLSGFADMGTGISYCFGIKLVQSFNYPMLSSRIKFFASKWHMQLICWFRRYISRPLKTLTEKPWLRDLIFVFSWCMAGFWYKFDLGGLIWGAMIGGAMLLESKIIKKKILKATGMIYTFLLVQIFGVFLAGDSAAGSLHYIIVMFGGTRQLADSFTIYLLRSYLVILLVSVYASTDLFRNMMMRTGGAVIRKVITAATPFIVTAVLLICTVFMSYSGSSEMILMQL